MTKTPKRLKTSDALGMFRAVLKESGFNPKEPDLKTGWEAFRRFAVLYMPDETLNSLEETLWTYDFDDDVPAFMNAVENSPSFKISMEQYHPLSSDIYQDEI